MPFANGENVGAYRIVEKLGQGGMATVFKAYHPALDRYVAIKVMHAAFMEDPTFLARFQREARIVAKLDHPHIVPIYDFAEHQGHPYLVMRFVEGETLKARMQRGRLEPPEMMRLVQAIGGALTYAHGQGVLHRDIKPSNVLLTSGGAVFLTDFGLARMAEAGESTLSRDMMVGTPQYISPEQAQGMRNLDARTDVYSLGVMLYEMLVGQAPFTADTPYAIVHDHIFTPLPLPRERNPELSEAMERMLLKALAKEPDDRFQSVADLIAAFEAAAGEGFSLPAAAAPVRPVTTPPPTVATPPPAVREQPPDTPTPPRGIPTPPPGRSTAMLRKKRKRWPWITASLVAIGACAATFFCLVEPYLGSLEELDLRANTTQEPGAPAGQTAEELLADARAARDEGNHAYAVELYEDATKTDPMLIPAYLEAADVLVKTRDLEGAKDILEAGIAATDDPSLHTHLAGLALFTDDWETADRELRWFQQEAPEHAFTHAYAGILALARGDPCANARPELERSLAIDPNMAWAHYGLAYCLRQEGDLEGARAELDAVLTQRDVPPILRQRAQEMLDNLDVEEETTVEAEFNLVITLSGQIADETLRDEIKTQIDEARAAWEAGEKQEAIDATRRIIDWLRQNKDMIDEPTARRLDVSLNLIVRLAERPEPPPGADPGTPPGEEPSPSP